MKQVENVKNLFNFKQYTNQTNNHYSLKFVFIPLSTHDFRKFFKTSFCLNKCPWRHLQQINFWNDEFYWKNRQLESDSYQIQKVGDKEKNNQGFPLGIGLWEGHFKQNGKKLAENYKVNTFAANHWERHVGYEGVYPSPPPPPPQGKLWEYSIYRTLHTANINFLHIQSALHFLHFFLLRGNVRVCF